MIGGGASPDAYRPISAGGGQDSFSKGFTNRVVESFVESDGLRAGASVFPRLGGIWVINAYGGGRDVREHVPKQRNTTSESSDSLKEDPHAK